MIEELYYDRDGSLISYDAYLSKKYSGPDNKRVALDEVNGYIVSTVWLGLDHGFGSGPPLIFETMVFGHGNVFPEATGNGPWDNYQDRYSTEADAVAGHARVVAAIRAGEQP